MQKELYLRKADTGDMDLLFKWANDPVVRNNAFHTEPISYETHKKWFNEILNNKLVDQYILVSSDEPIGQIRLTYCENYAEIDYSIAADKRGSGFGKKMLSLAIETVKSNHPEISRIIGKVKTGNKASEKAFLDTGFLQTFKQLEYICED